MLPEVRPTFIVYHSADADGSCSAAIVVRQCNLLGRAYTLIPYNYENDPYLLDKLRAGGIAQRDRLFVLDVSVQPKTMALLKETYELTWIDHHQSAIAANDPTCGGVRAVGVAACQLTWEYCFPDKKVPMLVKLIGQDDVWDTRGRYNWEKTVIPAQHYIVSLDLMPASKRWLELLQLDRRGERKLLADAKLFGNSIQQYLQVRSKNTAKEYAFETVFEGHPAIVINTLERGSRKFNTVYDPSRHDLMIAFSWCGPEKAWKFSLYSTKDEVNCGALSAKYAGGGHTHASGHKCKQLPFVLDAS